MQSWLVLVWQAQPEQVLPEWQPLALACEPAQSAQPLERSALLAQSMLQEQ